MGRGLTPSKVTAQVPRDESTCYQHRGDGWEEPVKEDGLALLVFRHDRSRKLLRRRMRQGKAALFTSDLICQPSYVPVFHSDQREARA